MGSLNAARFSPCRRHLLRRLVTLAGAGLALAGTAQQLAPSSRRHSAPRAPGQGSYEPSPAAVPGQPSRQQILDGVSALAASWYAGTCGQHCFRVLTTQFGLAGQASDTALALGALDGAAADSGGPCGALVGCLLALGLAFGRLPGGASAVTQEFCRRFHDSFAGDSGGRCQVSPSLAAAGPGECRAAGVAPVGCQAVVEGAARLAAELLLDWPRPAAAPPGIEQGRTLA